MPRKVSTPRPAAAQPPERRALFRADQLGVVEPGDDRWLGGERDRGQCTRARGGSATTTGNEHVAWLPDASVAVHVTVVVPRGKKLPEGGTQTTEGAASHPSVAVTVKFTISPGGSSLPSRTTRPEGHESVGGAVSTQPHLAMKPSRESSEAAKSPPAKIAGLLPSSKTWRAPTKPFIPPPSADQDEPSHLAIRFATTPPALVKKPPA